MINFMITLTQPLAQQSSRANTVPLPLQSLKGASPTHLLCNHQAIEILQNDNFIKEANFYKRFLPQLDSGATWADKGFKSIYHHYDAEKESGKWHWPNAAQMCEQYVSKAINMWKRKKHQRAMFYLGAASHLVQDMCVPHHARCVVMDGHLDFEKWVEPRRENYRVYDDGVYLNLSSPREWIHTNAAYSRNFYLYVHAGSVEEDYHLATSVLLPLAQRNTSGFWWYFYNLAVK